MTLRGFAMLLAALAPALLAQTSSGQKASFWRVYRVPDGLPESACVSVTVSPQGRVLARHLHQDSVTILDGYSISVLPASQSGRGRVHESPAGQLWTAVPRGLEEFRGGEWVLHPVPEIAAEFRGGVARVINPFPLHPLRQGQVLFLLPGGLMQYTADAVGPGKTSMIRAAETLNIGRFSSLGLASDGGLWISGGEGVARVPGPLRNLQADADWQTFRVPDGFDINSVQDPIESERGVVAVGGTSDPGQKQILRLDGGTWAAGPRTAQKLRYAWIAPGQAWAMTINSLLHWNDDGQLVESDEINARQYFDVAMETSGAFWLATSEGLFRCAPSIWRTPEPAMQVSGLVQCLGEDPAGRIWFMAGNRLYTLTEDRLAIYGLPAPADNLPPAQEIFPLRDGSVLLVIEDREASGEILLQFDPSGERLTPLAVAPGGSHQKVLGASGDFAVLVLTWPATGQTNTQLFSFDGNRSERLSETVGEAGAGTNLTAALSARRGDLWISGERGTALYQEGRWRLFSSENGEAPESALSFAEVGDGKVYCATRDEVWEYDGRNWSILRRGVDRINSMLVKRDGSIWVASNSGVQRWHQGAWVENAVEDGLPAAQVRQLIEDRKGRIWAGTPRGLSLHRPEADPDPPLSVITSFSSRRQEIQYGVPVTVTYTGRDKWKHTPRERLLYSYRLDDSDWSPFVEAIAVQLPELAAGKHSFQVRAMDRNGNVESKPAQVELAVLLPWYRETRLVLIAFAGMAGALFFAGLAFNRHRRLLRSYAEVEQKVAERSRQLEVASLELVQSQKMRALGTLAAGIAHDFNNILSIIKGSAQLIEDNLDQPQKVRTRLDRINTVVEQGAGIVKAMLGFSREGDPAHGSCQIDDTIKDTLTLLGDRFLREVQVRYRADRDLPEAQAPRTFIQQILLNCILNAAESMTQRKEIVISAVLARTAPAGLSLAPDKIGPYVALSIQDFGCGIAPEHVARIFEPFFTTKAFSSRRGTGLGLSMVYELAKKFGGGLGVESEPGRGSTFTLYVPAGTHTPAGEPAGSESQPT